MSSALGDYTAPARHGWRPRAASFGSCATSPTSSLLVDPARRAIEAAYDCPAKGAHLLGAAARWTKLYIFSQGGRPHRLRSRSPRVTSRVPLRAPDVMSGNGSGSEGLMPAPDGGRLVVIDNIKNDLRVIDARRPIPRSTGVPLQMCGALQPEALAAGQADVLAGRGAICVVTLLRWRTCLGDRRGGLAAAGHRARRQSPQGMAFPPDGPACSWPATTAASSRPHRPRLQRAVAAYDGGAGIEVLAHC